MVKKMLINACHPEECRVAVVADGLLEELDVQVNTREATLGNIYKGLITRVEPSLQAVFVDYGGSRNGFLSINDVHPSYFPESFEQARRRPRVQDVFKKDDHVIVQVNKEERSNKGASLTTNISLAGRYLVLMPGTDLFGVSRKIEDEKERKKLKEILQQLKLPENIGFIIRTAGMGRTKTELSRDLEYVLKLWQCIEKDVAGQAAPALLHREHDLVIRAMREHFSSDINEILVDDKGVHQKVREFFHQVMPKYEPLVKLYQEKRPLFNKYQLEEQIEHVYTKRIRLKSGGSIVLEPTEALVTIDVNSGGAIKEKGIEETAFKVNMEAAPEIARQLRLRDLGGIIVIDFIDMTQKRHKQEVEKAVKAALKMDRAKTKVLRISALGLLELSRQRLKSSLGTGEYLDCPVCDGAGKVRSAETSALSVFRKVKSALIKSAVTEVRATVPAKVAEYLLNNMRAHLVELENLYSSRVSILVAHGIGDKDILVEALKEELAKEEPAKDEIAEVVAAVEAVQVEAPAVPLETAAVPEDESATEPEKRSARKPGRRRRRSKKRPTTGAEEEVSLEGNEQQAASDKPLEGDSLDRPESAPFEPSGTTMGAEFSAQEQRQVVMEEQPAVSPDEPAGGHGEASARGSSVVEPAQTQASDLHSGSGGEAQITEEALPQAAEAPEQNENAKEKPAARKSSLQNYLPFL